MAAMARLAAVANGLDPAPTPSFWLDHPTARATDPTTGAAAPELPAEADFVIVGGGMTGVSVAYHLSKLGLKSVLLEGRELAGGATGRNGGVLSGGLPFHKANIEMLKGIMQEQQVDCEYRLGGYLRLAFEGTEDAAAFAAMEATETRQYWDAARVKDELKTDSIDGRKIAGGVFNKDSGHFWPAKCVHAIAKGAGSNATLCVGVAVTGLEPVEGGVLVRTAPAAGGGTEGEGGGGAAGKTIKAKRVCVCTNGWAPRLLPELAEVLYPVRNGVIMTAPVKAWGWSGSIGCGDGPEEIYAMKVRCPGLEPGTFYPVHPLSQGSRVASWAATHSGRMAGSASAGRGGETRPAPGSRASGKARPPSRARTRTRSWCRRWRRGCASTSGSCSATSARSWWWSRSGQACSASRWTVRSPGLKSGEF
eukprot:SAG22_NODE_26_length_29806_cov_19.885381_5_plen_421_part_00